MFLPLMGLDFLNRDNNTMRWLSLQAVDMQRFMRMTPQQCRAARTLLHWSQEELADNADLSVDIVRDFELVRRPIDSGVTDALQVALEYAGIEFLPHDDPDGALVRFRE